ncbi:MAG: PTS sugar transporter subunit IIA, partial [candidate division Zixibacteria bacterium]|nr:PTS sugar transporter subunit IIA [candidate division Zixibacteria bacterium]
MKLSKFCSEDLITFDLKSTEKEKVLEELVDLVANSALVKDAGQLIADVKEREELVTTGVGYGV